MATVPPIKVVLELEAPDLSEEQKQRAAACLLAKNALSYNTGTFTSGKPDAVDIYTLASYILTGEDPWACTWTCIKKKTTDDPDDGVDDEEGDS